MDNKFVKIVNNKIKSLLRGKDNYHIFFYSNKWFYDNFEDHENDKKYNSLDLEHLDLSLNIIKNDKYIPSKIISDKQLKETYEKLFFTETDYNKIKEILNNLMNYNLPSTIPNLPSYLKKQKNDTINILIVGSGPVGLYTASYLDYLYETSSKLLDKEVKILIIDNRIKEEGVRLPFTRTTSFGWYINKMNLFIKNIYNWKNVDNIYNERIFTNIYYLEYLLYLYVYNKNIPIYFTKKYETYESIEKFANNNNFNYIFDCTGGRLDVKLKPNISWNTDIKMKKKDFEIKLEGNKYTLYNLKTKSGHFSYTFVLNLLDYKFKPFNNNNNIRIITDKYHVKLLEPYRNKTMTISEYKKLEKKIINDELKNYFEDNTMNNMIDIKKVKYVKISLFSNNSNHLNRICKTINSSLTYIALGNSIGNSEYGIHFGMNGQLEFSNFVSQLIGIRDKL